MAKYREKYKKQTRCGLWVFIRADIKCAHMRLPIYRGGEKTQWADLNNRDNGLQGSEKSKAKRNE